MRLHRGGKTGFSLVELVIVIVIIGILAAIAIPRLSRGASGAGQSAVKANLATIRAAISMYAVEHKNVYPGPATNDFVAKLTKFSDVDGATVDSKGSGDTTHIYGPYLLAVPPCPVGENAGKTTANKVLVVASTPPVPAPGTGEGWVYNATTGEFLPNTTLTDEMGNSYSTY